MKMTRAIPILLIPLFMLGCALGSNPPQPTASASPTAGHTATARTLPDTWTPAPSPTATPTHLPSPTASITPTPTQRAKPTAKPTATMLSMPNEPGSLPVVKPYRLCAPVAEAMPAGFLAEGVIFAGDYSADKSWDGAPLRLADGVIEEVAGNLPGVEGARVSPDGKLLAYSHYAPDPGEPAVVLLNAAGQVLTTLSKEQAGGFGTPDWSLAGDLVFFNVHSGEGIHYTIVNPFTLENRSLAVPINDYFRGQPWDSITWQELDPSLTRLAYVTGAENGDGAALVTVPGGQQLWQTPMFMVRLSPAAWSPDGKRLLVINDDWQTQLEIYLIDAEGDETLWGYLPNDDQANFTTTRWSPDGRYVALGGQTLYVLDTKLNQIADYCTSANLLVWSPDSTQLIVHQSGDPAPEYANLVFDMTTHQSARLTALGQDVWALGWLADDVSGLPEVKTPMPTIVPTLPPPPPAGSLPIQRTYQQCAAVAPEPSPGLFNGLLTVWGKDPANERAIGFLSPETLTLTLHPELPEYWNGTASPDFTRLAYHGANADGEETLSIISAQGELLASAAIPTPVWGDNRLHGPTWLADEDWISFYEPLYDSYAATDHQINPFSGETRQVKLQFPDNLYFFEAAWFTEADATRTLAGYLKFDDETWNESNFSLWDFASQTELWQLKKVTVSSTRPAWSPDGKRLAVAALNDASDNFDRLSIYLVDRQGQAQLWVDLPGYAPETSYGYMAWSPDGRYLAFAADYANRPVLIMDTQRKQALDFCLPANVRGERDFFWSPDSTSLLFKQYDERPWVLLNVVNRQAARLTMLGEEISPITWLIP